MKKKILAGIMAVSMVTGLTACGSSNESTTSKKDSDGVETLTLSIGNSWYLEGWKALEKHINENAEELGFKLEVSSVSGDNHDNVWQVKFATDDLPDLGVLYTTKWIDTYCNGADKLLPLDGIESVSEYDEDVLEGYKIDDKLVAMPINSTVLTGVYYNKKVFEKAGIESVPKTWDELLEDCDKIKAVGITPVYYAASDNWMIQCNMESAFAKDAKALGTDIYGWVDSIGTHKTTYSECSNMERTLEEMKGLIDDGYVNESYLADTFDSMQEALANGECGMVFMGNWVVDNIIEKYPDKADDIGGFATPTDDGKNYINMHMPYALFATTKCDNPELAKKAINYISSAEAQQIYADAQPGLYLNNKVTSTVPKATEELYNEGKENDTLSNDWQEIVDYSYGDFGEYIGNYFVGSYKDASEVLKAMDDETAKNAKVAGDKNWD